MALASYRLWRFIGRDTWLPGRWLREELEAEAKEWRDRAAQLMEPLSPVGRSYSKRADRFETPLELISCPWCLGAWIAAAVVAWTDLAIGLELPALQWLAISTLVGLIGSVD